MKKNFICKCLLKLGLLLFLTVLMPFFPNNVTTAQAGEVEKEKVENYRLSIQNLVLAKGKTFILKTYNVGDSAKIYFKTDDQAIASVSDEGIITANNLGNTIVTVVIKDGANSASLTCDVTVGPPAISVRWTQSIVIIGKGKVDTLRVILKPSNAAEDAKFKSDNEATVYISPYGRITGNEYGLTRLNAYIDATDDNGLKKFDTCTVIVTSEDNVSKLENYFSDHPELDQIAKKDFLDALAKFFNEEFDQTKSTGLISSLDRYLNKVFDLN